MLKTIKLNEENFDRAVNESLTIVVDKLEKEKNLKFSLPIQNQVWTTKLNPNFDSSALTYRPIREKEQRDITQEDVNTDYSYWFNDEQSERLDSVLYSDSDFVDFGFESYSSDFDDQQEVKLKYLDSVERSEIKRYNTYAKEFGKIKFSSTFPKVAFAQSFNDTIEHSIKVFQNGEESKVIIITDGKIDTVDLKNFPSNLIPPPPPPPTDNDFVISNEYFNRSIYRTKRSTHRSNAVRHRVDTLRHLRSDERFRDFNERKLDQQRRAQERELEMLSREIEKQKAIQDDKNRMAALSVKRIELQRMKQAQAINQLAYEMGARRMELKDRVNFEELKNLLSRELKNKGVANPFEYALVNLDSTRKVVHSSPNYSQDSNKSIYATRLFPNNIIPLNDYIEVKFPDKDFTIYKSAILPISASLFFTLIVFLTFAITLVTIIKQKKLAEMKADFINNMTHELKTPIATISLASDSIDNQKVIEKPETVKYFTSIIREENSRMNKLVESVLQTARLERKTLKLNLKEVNLSQITTRVAEQMSIQAKAKGGEIHLDILADVKMIADENLMENVIFNLIDNAIKYSSSAPKVAVTLKKLPGGISLSVEDNGIGMSRSEQQRVFEKFYRVSQGDVHNIKGFGLGLSNVKEITELHGGMVQLRSELGKGSTFTLFFPFKTNGNE